MYYKSNEVDDLHENVEPDNQTQAAEHIDLTYARKLTANDSEVVEPRPTYYKIKQFLNGEAVFVAYRLGNANNLTPGRDPENEELSDRARSTIKRAARMIQYQYGQCSFCTLTYRKIVPPHEQAKRHLDNFLKRIRRKFPDLDYLWIAELQKRGAIHYHILFDRFIHYSIINKEWNEVVARWTKKKDMSHQKLYPNIEALDKPARYMAKYMSKDSGQIGGNYYDMSKGVRKLIQPVKEYYTEIRGPEYEIIKDCEGALDENGIDYLPLKGSDEENMTNCSYYADILDQGQKFQFGFYIPPPDQANQVDLITLLIQAIYPSSKIHDAA